MMIVKLGMVIYILFLGKLGICFLAEYWSYCTRHVYS